MKKYPKIVVGVLIHNQEGEIFLARSFKWGDKWVVPGGHLEWGESLHECVKREVKEETNLDILDIEFIDFQENILSRDFHEEKHMVFLDFAALAKNNEIILNDELQEYQWFTKNEINNLNLFEGTRKFIENYFLRKG